MKINIFGIIFFVFIITSFFYNFQNSILRLLAIILWATSAFFYSYNNNGGKLPKEIIYLSFFYIIVFFILLLSSPSSLNLSISGAAVESLTVFLFPAYFFIIFCNKFAFIKYIDKAIYLLVLLFLLEALYRYYLNPGCFMNYSCRYEAKTIGFFSTTNVTGGCIVILILSIIEYNLRLKRLCIGILSILLLTTMARAAILSMLIAVIFRIFISSKTSIFVRLLIIFIAATGLFYTINDLNLFSDGSYLSKLDFISNSIQIAQQASFTQLIFGFGSSYESIVTQLGVNGWSPHAPFLKAFLYYGIIGLILFALPLLAMVLTNKKMITTIFAYMIFSIAGTSMVYPPLAAAYVLTSKKTHEKK